MKTRFLTRPELIAPAVVFMSAHRGECLLDQDDMLGTPDELRGWINLADMADRYDITQTEILEGLHAHAARGVIRLAMDPENLSAVYVEALRDPRAEHGWRPWDVRFGVRLITERKSRPLPYAVG
ncbi:hypothetical protein E4L95_15250 [Paracoccus liaowanqingii]|uniref:Uncharacterized protein n=1 Tax=Paracoccus liaowanqingii TaxID=2560053 RepID=A0A4Z1C944_9RHOB|nr:hypothetical protein [Paracoccus liaowanqingii]TGN54890.1 hypothetical protein E4L95_15250 [Paracoccus liaowanqingii]